MLAKAACSMCDWNAFCDTNMVYKYLCGKSEDGLSVDVRTADIASELDISKRTTETRLAALRDAGLVRSAGSRRYPKILLNKV